MIDLINFHHSKMGVDMARTYMDCEKNNIKICRVELVSILFCLNFTYFLEAL